MSIKFVQSSDNTYLQYRLRANQWSTNVDDWYNETVSVLDSKLIVNNKEVGELNQSIENPEFIKAILDSDGKILFTIDKSILWRIFGHIVTNSLSAPQYNIEDNVVWCDETSEFSFVILDEEERILFGISRNDGSIYGMRNDVQAFGNMYVKKTSTTMDIYLRHEQNKYIHYIMSHRQKEYISGTESFYDNWGIDRVGLSSYDGESFAHVKYLYRDGETEQAIEVNNDGTYQWVGGAFHGYEQIKSVDNKRRIYFIIDGNYIEESESFDLCECSYIKIIQQSDIYEYDTTTNPFGVVFKEWIFENGELKLTTGVDFVKSLRIRTIAGSMMCVYRHDEGNSSKPYLTDLAIKDNEPFILYDLEDGHESVPGGSDCKEMTEYGELGFSFGMEIVDSSKMHSSGTLHIIESVSDYNKIYGYTMRALGTGVDVSSGTKYGLVTKQIIK
jgi:hypothetical protein